MHHSYIVQNVVDGAVVHKQAAQRLTRKHMPEETVVHKHGHKEYCNEDCVVYQFPQMECPDCGGVGVRKDSGQQTTGMANKLMKNPCPTCKGTGQVRDYSKEPGELVESDDTASE